MVLSGRRELPRQILSRSWLPVRRRIDPIRTALPGCRDRSIFRSTTLMCRTTKGSQLAMSGRWGQSLLDWIVAAVGVPVESVVRRIFAYEPPHRRVVVAGADVGQAGRVGCVAQAAVELVLRCARVGVSGTSSCLYSTPRGWCPASKHALLPGWRFPEN